MPDILEYQLDHAGRHVDSLFRTKGLALSEAFLMANQACSDSLKVSALKAVIDRVAPLADARKATLLLDYLDRDGGGQVTLARFQGYMGCLALLSSKDNLAHRGKVLQKFAGLVKKLGSGASFYDRYD